ncbi:MAG: WD40/YVTN/BNR-like repeat-containing protein [Candidatus Cyclobacteriaceae bacterium M3_2C_046]
MKTNYILVFISLILFTNCNQENDLKIQPSNFSWKHLGLNNQVINQVRILDDTIYTATDQGLFKKKTNDASWIPMGINEPIQSFLLFSRKEFLVSVFDRNDPSQASLKKTSDGGTNWINFQNGFGGNEPEPVFDLALNPSDSNQLFATGYSVVARSNDQGNSWKPVYGNWGGFATGLSVVEVNPYETNEVWAGGQNSIEQAITLFSADQGDSWQIWQNLVDAPSVLKAVAFDPDQAGWVYGGYEGGLIKTDDNGQQWQTLIESDDNRFFFGVKVHPNDPDIIYTAGWLKYFDNPQPLIVFRSADGGQSWKTYEFPQQIYGGVYSMDLEVSDQQDRLYLGLYKGGIYRFDFDY